MQRNRDYEQKNQTEQENTEDHSCHMPDCGAELGSIAFMSNLMREFFSFFLIPIIASRLNNYTCIAPAAATSEDTTLPVLLKYTNEETVVLAVLNGILCSFFVPILITFFFNI